MAVIVAFFLGSLSVVALQIALAFGAVNSIREAGQDARASFQAGVEQFVNQVSSILGERS